MSITNGYATLAELKTKLGISDSTQDTKLENSITNASRLIDQITGTFFYTKTLTTEKLDVFGPSDTGLQIKANGLKIYCPAPVLTITELLQNDEALTEDEDFFIYKSIGLIDKKTYWTSERKGISITGTIGYSAYPKDINEICLIIAAVISGLWKATYQAEDTGDPIEVIRNSVPRWVFDKLDYYVWANV
jgi:hypothetical protein